MATVLDRILDVHRTMAAADARPLEALIEQAKDAPPPRAFRAALCGPCTAVIAEIKRRSPSKGGLADHLVPGELATAYEAGGAACLSVLTDGQFFGGSSQDLAEARSACSLPVLRKDFTVSPRDVCDARLMGADAILLIVAALDDSDLFELGALARELSLAALYEVHDATELRRACAAGADIIGVNRRDLRTFEIDHRLAARLAPLMPAGVVRVAESGVRDRGDVESVAAAGYHAVLVGETLVVAPDAVAAVRSLGGIPRNTGLTGGA